MTARRRTLREYLTIAVMLGLIVTAAGIALLAWGAAKGGSRGVVPATLGAALMTIGVLSVINDAFFKDALARDIVAVQGIRESIARAGLQMIVPTDRLDLGEILERAQRIVVRPWDAPEWSDRQFTHLLRVARERAIEVDVHLPAPDTPFLDILAHRQRMPDQELRRRLNELVNDLAVAWDQTVGVATASRLRVFQYVGVPSTGLLMTDKHVVLETGPSLRYALADHATWTLVYKRDASPICDWVATQLQIDGTDLDQPVQVNERPVIPSP